MRILSVLFGSTLLVCTGASTLAACSDDDAKPAGDSAPMDGGEADAPSGASDAAMQDGSSGDSDGGADGGDAGVVEQVVARFGGIQYKLKIVTAAKVEGDVATISAHEDIDGGGGAELELRFDPKTGTTTCGGASKATVVFAMTPSDVYTADTSSGECSIVVTSFGDVGAAMSGTFTATVAKGGETLVGNGSFSVMRAE